MAAYEQILEGKYPAKAHAKRVVDHIRAKRLDVSGVLYLEGRMTKMIEDNDEAEQLVDTDLKRLSSGSGATSTTSPVSIFPTAT
jgi:hypothetical protein